MSDSIVDAAHAFLRGHTTGELRFEEHLRPVKYVITPDGRPAMPAMVAMIEAVDTVLFVPDCAEGAMELQVTLEPFEERGKDGAAADRWRIYHGQPDDVRWAYLHIDAARFQTLVIDGEVLVRPNPFTSDEGRLCKMMNQERPEDLKRMCAAFGGMDVEKPVMVGIDPLGIDVRAAFDVVRLPAPEPMATPQDAQRTLEAMAAKAR